MWKKIKNYNYEVNKKGQIRNRATGHILKPRIHKRYNYRSVAVILHKANIGKECQVSRLVATAFLKKPKGKNEVNHMNHDATDNRLKNLEWTTHKENMLYAQEHGRFASGEKNGLSKLKESQVLDIYTSNEPRKVLASKYKVTIPVIGAIQRKESWVKVINRYLVAPKFNQ